MCFGLICWNNCEWMPQPDRLGCYVQTAEGSPWNMFALGLCVALVARRACACFCVRLGGTFQSGVRPCGPQWLLWREAGGPSWFGEKSFLTSQGSLAACQLTWHTHIHAETNMSTLCRVRGRFYTGNAENRAPLSVQLKKDLFYRRCGLAVMSARCSLSARLSRARAWMWT